MNKSTEDFVEIPRWVRLLNGEGWFYGRFPSRRDVHALEAILVGFAVVLFVVSSLVTTETMAKILRVHALFMLACCYLQSVCVRLADTYKLWPSTEGVSPEPWGPLRVLLPRSRVVGYTVYLLGPIPVVAFLWWLVF